MGGIPENLQALRLLRQRTERVFRVRHKKTQQMKDICPTKVYNASFLRYELILLIGETSVQYEKTNLFFSRKSQSFFETLPEIFDTTKEKQAFLFK